MNFIYKSSNLYFVKIAQVKNVILPGYYTEGDLCYTLEPNIYIAKCIKTYGNVKTFKLLSNNLELTDKIDALYKKGDLFIARSIPLVLKLKKPQRFFSKKHLIELEKSINTKKTIEKSKGE